MAFIVTSSKAFFIARLYSENYAPFGLELIIRIGAFDLS